MTRLSALVAPLVLLSACSGSPDDAEVDAVSPSENEALDKAAAMIEQRRLPDDALPAPQAAPSVPDNSPSQGAMPADAAPQESGGPEPMELPSE